ncbi:transcription regulator [Actinidia rufa]|uniref:Transcription regulator n=1 Tax=Actinidia rufa TaxID=165716 RepID=A0A7J0FNW9_9ERIC|nr:transcription regulator [Actinidia rufa]
MQPQSVIDPKSLNIEVLLESDLIKSSSEERSLLKNLGSWLGKSTIGSNQVLRGREIDPKSLNIELLEPCQSSQAYQPPNPLTMGILGLLAEIYAMPNLKLNLKFDIEVLFKNLGVDLKDVTPTSLLKDRARQVEGNPDSNKDVEVSQQQMVGEVKSGTISTLNEVELLLEVASASHAGGGSHILTQYAAPLQLSSCTLTEDEKLAVLGLSDHLPSARGLLQRQSSYSVSQLPTPASNIEQQVIVNPKLHALGQYLHFRGTPCGSISSQLRNSLQGLNIANELLEQAVLLVTNDNLDLGCALIAQAAIEKGIVVEFPGIILRCISRDEAALAVAQKVFKGLYENASNSAHVTGSSLYSGCHS